MPGSTSWFTRHPSWPSKICLGRQRRPFYPGRSGHGPKLLAWFQNFCFFVWEEGLRRGSHQIQIFHRVCLKNFCLFDWAWALVGGRKKTKVLQTNPMQNLNLVGPPPEALPSHKKTKVLKSGYRFDPISGLPVCVALDILLFIVVKSFLSPLMTARLPIVRRGSWKWYVSWLMYPDVIKWTWSVRYDVPSVFLPRWVKMLNWVSCLCCGRGLVGVSRHDRLKRGRATTVITVHKDSSFGASSDKPITIKKCVWNLCTKKILHFR